jgi:hypothetical protein
MTSAPPESDVRYPHIKRATTSNEATEEFVDFTLEMLKRLDMRPGVEESWPLLLASCLK